MDGRSRDIKGEAGGSSPAQQQAGNSSPEAQSGPSIEAPSISLPKGGGAIRGIGEKFAANPVTGTGSMTVPIATSPGRSGFGPQLSLSYDSGAGNGAFGFGWNLSLPSITRKTDKGLPKYQDADESDIFILSGSEDLVPVLVEQGGAWVDEPVPNRDIGTFTYQIHRYRPRIEGLFARIERWTNIDDPGDVHWRSISKDNILTLYGNDAESRIFDPEDSSRIFNWLICETRDDKGNAVLYRYKAEDGAGINLTQANERNRGDINDPRRTANRYLKHIYYGNRTSLLTNAGERPPFLNKSLIETQIANNEWMFETVFDYGEHSPNAPGPKDAGAWDYRTDPFSAYRSGFEVRTTRLCQRVLMFHHFDGEAGVGNDCLVRSTDFTYSHEQNPNSASNPIYTFLKEVTQTGYKRNNGGYERRSMPPVEFEYTQPVVQEEVHDVDPDSLENLPIGVDGSTYQWTDLHGEGIPGILTEQVGEWFYKRNLSPASNRPVEFSPLESIKTKPNLSLAGGAQFMDLAGDGQPDLVVMDGPMPGLYEHDLEEGWESFRPFTSRLNRDMRDPNLKFVDLDGDGHADVMITENDAFIWHASLAEQGFAPARRVAQVLDEESGPRLVFADGTQSIYVSDMSGDGLSDLVRIRNREVCYWPNLGYCRFGAKITMDQAPHFDNPDQFDQKRIRLADIDGSGTTDIIYLHRDGVRLYFNQSGNSWSNPQNLQVFPRVDNIVSVNTTDLLGNGTACLVWSSPLPGDAHRQMRYVNLMGEHKPHLLFKTFNNLGAETRVQYAPSTKFYLRDKRDGAPWITRLPFPVHVVERTETYDYISRNRFVTTYAYHNGYFDGTEREFRGFGMVEQRDTEEIGALSESNTFPVGSNVDASSHIPPVHTKTWYHTGAYLAGARISLQFKDDYYRPPGLSDEEFDATLLADTILPAVSLNAEEQLEACRALKGSMLRQEVYALDGTDRHTIPYTVTEQNFTIRPIQPKLDNRYAVFVTHAREAINYHYERNPADPRIQHALTLEVDEYSNIRKSVAVGYGRRENIKVVEADGQIREIPNPGLYDLNAEDQEKQTQKLITYTENDVTVDDPNFDHDNYRTPLPCEVRSYELTGIEPDNGAQRFSFDELEENGFAKILNLTEVPYQQPVDYSASRKRLIEQVRTLYRPNDCGESLNDDPLALLTLGELQSRVLPGESYMLAFTPGLAAETYVNSGKLSQAELDIILANEGKYVHSEGDDNWWIPSGRVFYSPGTNDTAADELSDAQNHFFLPRRYRNPFHTAASNTESIVSYDVHDLLLQETVDALNNIVTVGERDANDDLTLQGNNYRVLQAESTMGPNRNRSVVAFDALGLVVGTAVMGKPEDNPQQGDLLEAAFSTDLTPQQIDEFEDDPLGQPAFNLLDNATSRIVYDIHRFYTSRQNFPNDPEQWQAGFAATIARKTHVSDLPASREFAIQVGFSYSDGFGREIQKKIQAEPEKHNGVVGLPRWVGSGWTIFNNKGKPVRQYEPFFSNTHDFEFDREQGVSPILFYDPVGRVVATIHPNHTYEKVIFDPWHQTTYDVNDTVTFDPVADNDINGFLLNADGTERIASEEYLPTWYQLRTEAAHIAEFQTQYPVAINRQHQTQAASNAAAHADTPTIAHFDTLGRPFLSIADNGRDNNGNNILFETRTLLDIEGNQRLVKDARDLTVMRYDYYMAGPEENQEGAPNRIHQASMEAGERWVLSDITGNPIRSWDSRGHTFRTEYDALRRPTGQYVSGEDTDLPDSRLRNNTMQIENIEYGESLPLNNAVASNLRTRVYRQNDSAGIVTNENHDFKGNLILATRQLCSDYADIPDWSQNPVLDQEVFASCTRYDALNRPIQQIAPYDRGAAALKLDITQITYNDANLLEAVHVWLAQNNQPTNMLPVASADHAVVRNIDYDAKGQRELIEYGNGAITHYAYDETTFRLTHLYTRRDARYDQDCGGEPPLQRYVAPILGQLIPDAPCGIQNLRYTYDPVGNITHIHDLAQPRVYFDNQCIEASNDYLYDPVYRLTAASGREHKGDNTAPGPSNRTREHNVPYPAPCSNNELQRYTEHYRYDEVGNIMEIVHRAGGTLNNPGQVQWQRRYQYTSFNNQLRSTSRPGEGPKPEYSDVPADYYQDTYSHDHHGNITTMPHLSSMKWNFKDQLLNTTRQVVNDEPPPNGKVPETTHYVYDSSGQRARKVTIRQTGNRKDERIYFGGVEIYRQYKGNGVDIKLQRESLHVMDDKQRVALIETKTFDDAGVDAFNNDMVDEAVVRYQVSNHLGSACTELNEQASVISYEEYHPYGTTAYHAKNRSVRAAAKRFRYTGKERDEENGFYYYGARYYAAWLGRWFNPDPLGLVDGVNVYGYVRQNPIKLMDPQGLAGEEPEIEFKQQWIKLKRVRRMKGGGFNFRGRGYFKAAPAPESSNSKMSTTTKENSEPPTVEESRKEVNETPESDNDLLAKFAGLAARNLTKGVQEAGEMMPHLKPVSELATFAGEYLELSPFVMPEAIHGPPHDASFADTLNPLNRIYASHLAQQDPERSSFEQGMHIADEAREVVNLAVLIYGIARLGIGVARRVSAAIKPTPFKPRKEVIDRIREAIPGRKEAFERVKKAKEALKELDQVKHVPQRGAARKGVLPHKPLGGGGI